MHESRLVQQLLDEAERRAAGPAQGITRLRFQIGAMAAVSEAGLRHGASDAALNRWGFCPAIEIDHAADPLNVAAQGVRLVSISVGSS